VFYNVVFSGEYNSHMRFVRKGSVKVSTIGVVCSRYVHMLHDQMCVSRSDVCFTISVCTSTNASCVNKG